MNYKILKSYLNRNFVRKDKVFDDKRTIPTAYSNCYSRRAKLTANSLQLKANSGFSLVETLVAISILMIAIGGPLLIAERSLATARYSKDQITAFYLAQEAIEYIKNTRDKNVISGQQGGNVDWLSGITTNGGKCQNDSVCGIDPNAEPNKQTITCGSQNDNCRLLFNQVSNIYGHRFGSNSNPDSGWAITPFQRQVTVVEVVDDIEAKISVTVKWNPRPLVNKTFTLTESIFNWR
ncbi:MAG: hypothetical protein COV70_03880 [Parcubacteria group bacterium CG11_big_fil_rev_8_21_14_0_20_39_22]|nr:MAG: hypothetical protein COV70_03880 [Parcubacteria group bacterium CG11_big_fil_rev_8_21_14_0_20_39_22]